MQRNVSLSAYPLLSNSDNTDFYFFEKASMFIWGSRLAMLSRDKALHSLLLARTMKVRVPIEKSKETTHLLLRTHFWHCTVPETLCSFVWRRPRHPQARISCRHHVPTPISHYYQQIPWREDKIWSRTWRAENFKKEPSGPLSDLSRTKTFFPRTWGALLVAAMLRN